MITIPLWLAITGAVTLTGIGAAIGRALTGAQARVDRILATELSRHETPRG